MADEQLTWLESKSGTSTAAAGWTALPSGTSAELHSTGYRPSSSGSPDAVFVRPVFDSDDLVTGLPRVRDSIDFQFRFLGSTGSPSGWGNAEGVHGAFIDDGARAAAVQLGSGGLVWVSPYDGEVIADILPAYPWQLASTLLLRKRGSERFELWSEGELLSEIGYEAAGTTSTPGLVNCARVGFGRINVAGTGLAAWDRLEVGLNRAVPPEWRVRRLERAEAPAPIRNRWNDRWEAIARAVVGQLHQAQTAIRETFSSFTAGTVVSHEASFVGDQLPWVEDPDWATVGSAGDWTVHGDRVVVVPTGETAARWTFPAPVRSPTAQLHVSARFHLLTTTSVDAYGRVGPYVMIRDGNRGIYALMVLDQGTGAFGWLLSSAVEPSTEDLTANGAGDVFFPVEPWREHKVDLRVIGPASGVEFGVDATRSRVVLAIDDVVVDDVPYLRFGATVDPGEVDASIGMLYAAVDPKTGAPSRAIQSSAAIQGGYAAVTYSDQQSRPAFIQAQADSLAFVGGKERNDHLEAWSSRQRGVELRRGTFDGLRIEYRRIAFDDTLDLRQELTPAAWFLDLSYPDVTPIFLDAPGFIRDTWVEFYDTIPNYTPEAFCDLVHRYLAPISTIESAFHCGLIQDVTDVQSAAGQTTVTITSTDHLAVGDVIALRQTLDYSAVTIDYTDVAVTAADGMLVGVGPTREPRAVARIDAEGTLETENLGTLALPGLDSERTNTITAAAAVKVASSSAADVGMKAIVLGLSAANAAQREELTLNGTTTVVGVSTWNEVHGVLLTSITAGNVVLRDNTDNDILYTVTAGALARGCKDLRPGLGCLPNTIPFSTAGSVSAVLAGANSVGTPTLEKVSVVASSGETATVWSELLAVGLGHVAAATTLTLTTRAVDRTGVVRLVSSSASDVQTGMVYGLTVDAEDLQSEAFTLNGTTNVTLTKNWGRISGIVLDSDAVGNVTFTIVNGVATLTKGTIAIGQRTWGMRRVDLAVQGHVRARLYGTTPSRTITVVGVRADGAIAHEAFIVTSTSWTDGAVDWSRILDIGVANIYEGTYVKVEVRAWYGTWLEVQNRVGSLGDPPWVIVGLDGLFKPLGQLGILGDTAGVESGLRDLKSRRHTTNKTLHHLAKVGTDLAEAEVSTYTSGPLTVPILVTSPSAIDEVRYELTGADLTEFQTLWASGTFTVFFRFRRTVNNGGGGFNLVKADGGTSTTAEQVSLGGLATLRIRYNGVTHDEAVGGLVNDTWYSAAVVVSANVSQWYLNGSAQGGATNHGGAGTSTIADFLRNLATTDAWDITDFAVYSSALSSGNVSTLHSDTNGDDALRRNANLWSHWLDPQHEVLTATANGPVTLPGTYDVYENAVIASLTDTEVVVEDPDNTFTAGAVLRIEV